jgi:hypothetical protein
MQNAATDTTKSSAEKLKDAEAALTRAEAELVKVRLDLHAERARVLREQTKGAISSHQDAYNNLTLANLAQADAERWETLAKQDVAKCQQNVNFYQRQHVNELKNFRISNARVA